MNFKCFSIDHESEITKLLKRRNFVKRNWKHFIAHASPITLTLGLKLNDEHNNLRDNPLPDQYFFSQFFQVVIIKSSITLQPHGRLLVFLFTCQLFRAHNHLFFSRLFCDRIYKTEENELYENENLYDVIDASLTMHKEKMTKI